MVYPAGSFPLVATPEQEIAGLRSQVARLQKIVSDQETMPSLRGTVGEVGPSKSVVVVAGAGYEVLTPSHLKLDVGQRVNIDPKTNAITAILKEPVCTGAIRNVTRVISKRLCEVFVEGSGHFAVAYGGTAPEVGDQVVLDSNGAIVVLNLGKKVKPKKPPMETGISWDDIAGLEDVKQAFVEAIESPVKDAALHKRYGKKPVKGALVCGPPGCGKTMLGKASATSLARTFGKESTSSGFIYCKGPELLRPLVGQSEEGVRKLFTDARDHFAEHGYPAIIFVDEGDALLMCRGKGPLEGMEKTIVPMFLAEMDGLDEMKAFVLVATNRPDMIDPAVTRNGRLELKLFVRRPTKPEAEATLRMQLRGRPLDGLTIEEAAAKGAAELFDDRRVLYMFRTVSGKDQRFSLGRLISGDMCAGLVERATTLAMRREKAGGEPSGISAADIAGAADWLLREQRVLDHSADLAEAIQSIGKDYRSHEKILS